MPHILRSAILSMIYPLLSQIPYALESGYPTRLSCSYKMLFSRTSEGDFADHRLKARRKLAGLLKPNN